MCNMSCYCYQRDCLLFVLSCCLLVMILVCGSGRDSNVPASIWDITILSRMDLKYAFVDAQKYDVRTYKIT